MENRTRQSCQNWWGKWGCWGKSENKCLLTCWLNQTGKSELNIPRGHSICAMQCLGIATKFPEVETNMPMIILDTETFTTFHSARSDQNIVDEMKLFGAFINMIYNKMIKHYITYGYTSHVSLSEMNDAIVFQFQVIYQMTLKSNMSLWELNFNFLVPITFWLIV